MDSKRIHPLDKLIADDSLFMLEAMIPFVDFRMKRLLVIFIKYKELTSILSSLNNPVFISECGFDCHPKNTDDMLSSMCRFMPGDFSKTINQMKQMKGMMDMMEIMNSQNNCDDHNRFTGHEDREDFDSRDDREDFSDNNDSLYESVLSILDDQ
ncbi:MAG: hypothetical protein ACI4D8_08075 [Wujia sp.]